MTPADPLPPERPTGEPTKAFIYLLNAMEAAAQADKPAEHGYAEKRRAVLEYVARLSLAAAAGATTLDREKKLRLAGGRLATVAHNLAQKPTLALYRFSLEQAYRAWDAVPRMARD